MHVQQQLLFIYSSITYHCCGDLFFMLLLHFLSYPASYHGSFCGRVLQSHMALSSGNALNPEDYKSLPSYILREQPWYKETSHHWRCPQAIMACSFANAGGRLPRSCGHVCPMFLHCTAETSTEFFSEHCVSMVKCKNAVKLGAKTLRRPLYVQRGEQIEKCVAYHRDQWYTNNLVVFCVCLWKEGRGGKDGSHSRWCDWSTR